MSRRGGEVPVLASCSPGVSARQGARSTPTRGRRLAYAHFLASCLCSACPVAGLTSTLSTDMQEAILSAFKELYGGLPRQGPGDAEATLAALRCVSGLPETPRVLDAGCGSGASTLVLAQALPRSIIVGIDTLEPLLERLKASARAEGLDAQIETRCISMETVDVSEFDLIWSEGAVYSLGVDVALRHWVNSLACGAHVVFSEACWFAAPDERDATLVDYWREEYPQMRDEAGVAALIDTLGGYEVLATLRLGRDTRMQSFYGPLARRCDHLRTGASGSMLQVIAMAEREIEIFRRYSDCFGYTFFVLKRTAAG